MVLVMKGLTINSDDPDTPSLGSTLWAMEVVTEYPTANIVPKFVSAPTVLDLNGSSSTSPNGTNLTYLVASSNTNWQ